MHLELISSDVDLLRQKVTGKVHNYINLQEFVMP